MKGNVVLKSKDRELFGIVISQETKEGFLSLTELTKAYEAARKEYGWSEMDISSLMKSKKTVERIFYILSDNGLLKTEFLGFSEQCETEGITKVLKSLNVWKTTGKGENRMVMCHPYIWVSVAVELNPRIYSKVITFVTDKLIVERIEACNGYRPMIESICTIVESPVYPKYSIAINNKVFGYHETGMRNTASAFELSKISEIEHYVVRVIRQGFVTDDSGVMKAINTYII